MIKYAFANCNGEAINIEDVTPELRKANVYTCVCCGNRMIAYLKGKKEKHFKHYDSVEHDNETYLHKTAKLIFIQSYRNAIANKRPVYIDYYEHRACDFHKNILGFDCSLASEKLYYDLTSTFLNIDEEKYTDGLKADILLSSSKGDEILIEIFVTHRCEAQKINSGKRIIEIKIENEGDLLRLSRLFIKSDNENIKYYNFKSKTRITQDCKENKCNANIEYIIINKDLSYEVGHTYFKHVQHKFLASNVISFFIRKVTERNYHYYKYNKLYREMLNIARENNFDVKSCFYCKHYKFSHSQPGNRSVFCKKLYYNVKFDEAIICFHYRKNE